MVKTWTRRPCLRAIVAGALLLAACSRSPTPSDDEHPEASSGPAELQLLRDPVQVSDFSVADLDGRTITSASLRGKVVLVNFWATWCPPCRAEIPDLVRLQDKYRDKLVVLGISEDEGGVDLVKAFAAEHRINYPIAMETPELAKVFKGVSALPTTFVIDPEGRIQQRHVGLLNAATTELETQVLSGSMTNVRIERIDDPTEAILRNAAQAKEIPGVDLTKMSPAARTAALKALNSEDCTCGCGLTLAACRINDPACEVSLPIARALAERVAAAH